MTHKVPLAIVRATTRPLGFNLLAQTTARAVSGRLCVGWGILLAGLASSSLVLAGPSAAPASVDNAESGDSTAASSEALDPRAPRPLPGQLSSKFGIDLRNPEGSIPGVKERNKNPLEFGYFIQDLLDQAEQARQHNDFQGVISFYRAVAKAVPERAKAWSKLCEAYEYVKDTDRAIRACKYAIDRPGVELQDYVRYVHLILSKPGAMSADDRTEVTAVLAHMEHESTKQVPLDVVVNQLKCEMGVKVKDLPILETCTKALAALAPSDPKTVVFQWTLAMMKGQRAEAERLLGVAKSSGVVLESLERMQKVTSSLGSRRRLTGFVVALAALLGLAAYAVLRRRALTQRLAR